MKLLSRLIKISLFLFIGLFLLGLGGIGAAYLYLEPDLPSTDILQDVKLQVPLHVYSRDHKLIAEFGEKRREPLKYDEVPERMIQAFLAAEDDRFFEHPGVDYQGILRAAGQLLLTGKRRQGGSTITMQVARNFFLSNKKTFTRKLNEIFLALKIERELSKEEILELYLNKIYLGHRSYGVGAASLVYYGRPVGKLELSEIAMIAGLPKAPSRYNPVTNPSRALLRRNYVLGRMLTLEVISRADHDAAKATPVTATLHRAMSEVEASYVAEMVRAEAVRRFGNAAYTGGYTIHTTIDSRLQVSANAGVRQALHAYDKRHGYRGAEAHIDLGETPDPALMDKLLREQKIVPDLQGAVVLGTDGQNAGLYLGPEQQISLTWQGLSWARTFKDPDHQGPEPKTAADILQAGDLIRIHREIPKEGEPYWRLAQIPKAAGALVSVDPDNGAILALVGGYDFYLSKFNRITQAKRQPGSGFKAFIYSAALEAGYTPASLINDAPVVFDDPALEASWRPENYSGKFFGPTRLRYALTKSRNLVSIRLLRAMGIKPTLEYVTRFGFDKGKLPRDLSLALGSGAITPLQMAEGYSVLANGGYHIDPFFIVRIEDDHRETIFRANPAQICEESPLSAAAIKPTETPEVAAEPTAEAEIRCAKQVITPQNHYLMNSMMRDVVQRGTARKARALGRKDIAGKTGTTNDQRDAWFNGFNRNLVAIAWVGFDDFQPLGRGEVGGRAALPAWIHFMRTGLEGTEEAPLEMPEGMVTMRIDEKTGKPVNAGHKGAIFEVFREKYAPEISKQVNGTASLPETEDLDAPAPEEDPF